MQTPVTPTQFFQVATGFMASKHLFVATEIGLFEHITNSGSTINDLSAATKIPQTTLRMVADAMVALGFVELRGDRYFNSPSAATFLSGHTHADLRPMMRFSDRLAYRRWLDLEQAVRSDGKPRAATTGASRRRIKRYFQRVLNRSRLEQQRLSQRYTTLPDTSEY